MDDLNGRPEQMTDIRRLGPADSAAVVAAAELFDNPPQPGATQRFLAAQGHHLFIAYDDADAPIGFVTGIEMTHPDKGTEMFLYELGVHEQHRGRGVGRALVSALADVARAHRCYGMWVLTDDDNQAALRAYTAAGASLEDNTRLLAWNFET
jgi:ribosomal protein S18 acetylase RimI-like enzyme